MVELHCGDCRVILERRGPAGIAVVVTDPPYGMSYESRSGGRFAGQEIAGDDSTELRDWLVSWAAAHELPMLCFGTWKIPRLAGTRMVLTWEKGDHVGMGDPALPWKPTTEEIYVLGSGFGGRRGSSLLKVNAVSPNLPNGREVREHPTQKPIALMGALLTKCPPGGVLDPFMGSGSTGVAAVRQGRDFVGIELAPVYFNTAERRIRQAEHQLILQFETGAEND